MEPNNLPGQKSHFESPPTSILKKLILRLITKVEELDLVIVFSPEHPEKDLLQEQNFHSPEHPFEKDL